jgi:hypothetical protein
MVIVQATWKRMVLLLVTTLVGVAMMAASAMPVFAAPQGPNNPPLPNKSQNSCGKANQANPEFPASTPNLGTCGIDNNPVITPPPFPPAF